MSARLPSEPIVTGWSGGSDYFQLPCRDTMDMAAVKRVLRGEQLGVLFRIGQNSPVLQETSQRFWASPERYQRSTEAPSFYLGAYHYGRRPEDYVREAARLSKTVSAVIGSADHPWFRFLALLGESLASEGKTMRCAEHDGVPAAEAALRAWTDQGAHALPPHEDLAQCLNPLQQTFEISMVAKYAVCAANLCVESQGGGELEIWNIRPDQMSREVFETTCSGGPYPMSAVSSVEGLTIDIQGGDLYVFNASHLHSVRAARGRRMNIYSLLGFRDDQTVIRWT